MGRIPAQPIGCGTEGGRKKKEAEQDQGPEVGLGKGRDSKLGGGHSGEGISGDREGPWGGG